MKPRQIIPLLVLLAVFVMLAGMADAQSEEDEIEWLEPDEYTLYWGDEVNASGYLIKALDFSSPGATDVPGDYVALSIRNDTAQSWSSILSVNNSNIPNSEIFDNRLRINATDVVTGKDILTPYTTINVYIAKELPPVIIPKKTWINDTLDVEKTASQEIYIDERAYITIEIKNLKDLYFEGVTVSESLPEHFVMDPDTDIGWTFDLAGNGKKLCRYSIKSLRPGEFTLPATKVALTHLGITYIKYTNTSQLTIHGPFIHLTKTAVPAGVGLNDTVEITVIVNNDGDRAAHVRITDDIPTGAVFTSGIFSDELVLPPSGNHTIKYSIQIDRTGDVIIPAARVKFADAKGYGDTVESKQIMIPAFQELVATEVPVAGGVETEVTQDDGITPPPATPPQAEKREITLFGKTITVPALIDRVIKVIEAVFNR